MRNIEDPGFEPRFLWPQTCALSVVLGASHSCTHCTPLKEPLARSGEKVTMKEVYPRPLGHFDFFLSLSFFFFGCTGSSLLCAGFLYLQQAAGYSLTAVASFVVEHGL